MLNYIIFDFKQKFGGKMRKMRLFFTLTLAVIASLLILSGCGDNNKASMLALKDHDSNSAIEMTVGNFDYGSYTLLVTHGSGEVEEVALSEEMISEADIFKFYQEGEHTITASYGGQSCTFKISVRRATFGELRFSENRVFTYDGNSHTVEVEGDLPANAVITYPSGNSFVNAGTYDVTAIVSCDGYVSQKLSTTVKIERAKYDMSGVSFDSKEIVYDGATHSIEISGTLPEGVSAPKYTIDGTSNSSAINVGEYTVTAVFTNNNPNYDAIPSMEAVLSITPAELTVEGLDIVFKNENGDLLETPSKVYDGLNVLFELNDYSKLLKKATVSYSVFDKKGVAISTSNINTNMNNAGEYTVKAEFVLVDNKNYKPIDPVVRTFEIKKASYDMSRIHFDSNVVAYNGEEHRLVLEIPNDIDILSEDVTYEYYLDGELVVSGKDVGVTEAGKYTVKAIITVKNENYEQIDALEATLQIEAQYEIEPEPMPEPIS